LLRAIEQYERDWVLTQSSITLLQRPRFREMADRLLWHEIFLRILRGALELAIAKQDLSKRKRCGEEP
jgi:hypothetical protein